MNNRSIQFSGSGVGTLFVTEFGAHDDAISVQITSAATGATVTYYGSNDGVNFVAITGMTAGVNGPVSSTSTTSTIIVFPAQTRYFKAEVTAYTSGTVSGVAVTGKGWLI